MVPNNNANSDERREKFRRSDLTMKIIFILFGIIQTGIGFGLREIWYTQKDHTLAIAVLETEVKIIKSDNTSLKNEIYKKLDKIDDKLGQILETGILNQENGRTYRGKSSFNTLANDNGSGVLSLEVSGAERAAKTGDDL